MEDTLWIIQQTGTSDGYITPSANQNEESITKNRILVTCQHSCPLSSQNSDAPRLTHAQHNKLEISEEKNKFLSIWINVFNITTRKPSCAKIMFSQVSACHSVHGRYPNDHYPWYIGTRVRILSPPPPSPPILDKGPPPLLSPIPLVPDMWPPLYHSYKNECLILIHNINLLNDDISFYFTKYELNELTKMECKI